jgi:hypothetical protein
LGKEWSPLAWLSKDLFMDVMEHRGLVRFWLEWDWIGDVSNFAYPKRESVSDFFSKWGSFRFGGVRGFICDIGGVSGVMGWPNSNTNSFLVACRDLKFGISDKGVEGVVPPDEEPRVIDEFEG